MLIKLSDRIHSTFSSIKNDFESLAHYTNSFNDYYNPFKTTMVVKK